MAEIRNTTSNTLLSGTSGDDTIHNGGANVTIKGGAGDDEIENVSSYNVSINAGKGDDTISNSSSLYNSSNIIILGGAGNDEIESSGSNVSINAGSGNDDITNYGDGGSINAGSGNDYIYFGEGDIDAWQVTVNAGDGDDFITADSSKSQINGGAGNDTIYLYSYRGGNTLKGGEGADLFYYSEGESLLEYDEDVDEIYNDIIIDYAEEDTIQFNNFGGTIDKISTNSSGSVIFTVIGDYKHKLVVKNAADKVITYIDSDGNTKTYGNPKLITLTDGNDTIRNTIDGATINALGGNDSIYNGFKDSVLIDGGAGNDTVRNYGSNVTINGGTGNDDVINSKGDLVKINTGVGDDYVLNGEGDSVTINTGTGNDYVYNYDCFYATINTDAGNDSIYNYKGDNVIIDSGAGNDSISNYGNSAKINTGAGSDTIYNNAWGYSVTINAGAGNDSIANYGASVKINIGADSDYVYNGSNSVTIDGGDGNDTIDNKGYKATIDGGEGDDSITNSGANVLFTYTEGDGNDIITGFNETSTLQIGDGKGIYSSQTSGKDIIVSVGDGKVTLKGAASLSSVNIAGTDNSEPVWSLSGTTAIYSTPNETLITVNGIKSLDGISLKKKVVTVSESSLNEKKITISGNGYTLKLSSDVDKPTTKKAVWTYKSGTATYKSSYKTAGYKLASNSKSITYSAATTASTLATVKGVKSKDGLSISDKIVTVSEASVNAKKITISGDGYTLKLADGLAPTTKKAAWTYSNGTATYKSSYKIAGYKLASNSKSITYSAATTASTLATVKGVKSKDGLSVSGKKITLKNSALSKKVTVSGSYEFDFASDYKQATISGSSKADTITARGKKISVNGGKGDDTIKILGTGTVSGGAGADIFYYKSGGSNVISDYAAEDKISIASGTANISTSGNDLIFTIGNGKISVTGGANQTVTYFDSDGEHVYKKSSDGIKYNAKKTSATLLSSYDADSFTFDADLKSLDATKVEQDLIIIGNKKANTITGSSQKDTIDGGAGTDDIKGGKGNDSIFGGTGDDTLYGGEGRDTLWGGKDDDYLVGGAGNDVFLYTPGDGIDRISDYDFQHDTIKLLSGSVDNKETAGEDIVFTVGDGKIIVEKVTYAVIIDGSGTQIPYRSPTKS